MIKFIELKRKNGTRFLFDIGSGWQVNDKGRDPAMWMNDLQGCNLDCSNTYDEIREKLLPPPKDET